MDFLKRFLKPEKKAESNTVDFEAGKKTIEEEEEAKLLEDRKRTGYWPLGAPLLYWQFPFFDGKEVKRYGIPWTYADAYEGLQVFGGTGSGKTSGTGRYVAMNMLLNAYGGLVLCAKPEEADDWEKMMKEAGRENDLIRFSPERGKSFNFIDYEMSRKGKGAGISENVISVLMQIVSNNASGGSKDPVWENEMRRLLRNTLDLLGVAKESIRMKKIMDVITKSSFAEELILQADVFDLTESQREDLEVIQDFFNEWKKKEAKLKDSVMLSLTGIIDPFLRGQMRDCFCSETNCRPEDAGEGKVIVVDMSIKEYNELGRYSAVIWKFLFQRYAERRGADDQTRPLFIFADESQFFITSTDQEFQTTARSSRCATVLLTQNLPNYYNARGGSQKGKHEIDSLLGNLQTKVFHQNGDPITNEWASRLIGKEMSFKNSKNFSSSDNGFNMGNSQSEHKDLILEANVFQDLDKGGPGTDFFVEAYLFQSGKKFWNEDGTEKPFRKIGFKQTEKIIRQNEQ